MNAPRPSRGTGRRRARGMTLVEVLVSLLIFSVGLLGLMTLQARALRYSTGAEDTNRAALLANEIAAQMLTGQNVVVPVPQMAAWRARVADATGSGLPNGVGTVVVDNATGLATITIVWRPPTTANGAPNGLNRYVTQVKVVS